MSKRTRPKLDLSYVYPLGHLCTLFIQYCCLRAKCYHLWQNLWAAVTDSDEKYNNRCEKVKRIFQQNPIAARIVINWPEENGFTLLFMAVEYNDKALTEFLIDNGANVNQRNIEGSTPLFLGSWNNNETICELLSSKGAEKNIKNNRGLEAESVNNAVIEAEIIDYESKRPSLKTVKFTMHKQLGKGSSGMVFMGKYLNTNNNMDIAVKKIDFGESKDKKEYADQEAQIMSKMDCKHIVKIYNACLNWEKKVFFILMEYMPGNSLYEQLKDKKRDGVWPEKKIIKIALGIINGLVYMHTNGYVHRDVKSLN
ncbi:MAG: protein kinase, partial [Proteobacteria bacterium]|nr:protein kinase [Pseudomonadota bacterium]